MSDQGDTEQKGDQKSTQSPPPPPVPPQNEGILPGVEQNPPDGHVHVTVNLPSTIRPMEWLQSGINAALVVVGVVAICIYGGQLNVMRRTLDKMDDQSWWGRLAVRGQRPVFMQRIQLPDELHSQNDFKAVVELKNVGPTPSVDLIESTQIWIADSEKATSAAWKKCPKVGVLTQSESVSCETASLSVTPDEIQAYQRKTSRLYVRVYATYWDDIEGDFRHQQSMCLFHTLGEPLDHFSYCAGGNAIWHDNFQKREKENPERPPGAP